MAIVELGINLGIDFEVTPHNHNKIDLTDVSSLLALFHFSATQETTMPCYIINDRPASEEEYRLWVEQGYTASYENYLYYRNLLRPPGGSGVTFMTGDLGDHCGNDDCADVGLFLCDYPVGHGKTCDRPLCDLHAHKVGEDMHYCSTHYKEWTAFKKSGSFG